MTILVQNQTGDCHRAWGLKQAPAQQRKRKSREADGSSPTTAPVAAAAPARKRFTGSVLRKYAAELAVFDSIDVQLSESDCPYL
jgi:hypothetical protein